MNKEPQGYTYIAGRRLLIGSETYLPGDSVPLDKCQDRNMGRMIMTGDLIQISVAGSDEVATDPVEGGDVADSDTQEEAVGPSEDAETTSATPDTPQGSEERLKALQNLTRDELLNMVYQGLDMKEEDIPGTGANGYVNKADLIELLL